VVKRTSILAIAAVFAFCSSAFAQTTSLSFVDNSGNNVINLTENMSGQTIDIYAMNVANMNFEGFTLWMQIGDGGTAAGGTDTGPAMFTAVDMFPAGSIYDNNNEFEIFASPLAWGQSQDQLGSGQYTRDGLVAQVTFDTTGFFEGDTTTLALTNVGGNDTFFVTAGGAGTDIPTNNVATINIVSAVPEPGSFMILAGASTLALLRRRRS
jgi:hypothetical protein